MQISGLVSIQQKPRLTDTFEQTIITVLIYTEKKYKKEVDLGMLQEKEKASSQRKPSVTKDNDRKLSQKALL